MQGAGATDKTAVWLGVNELIAAYADCIDEDRLEEWPDFFVEHCHYLITDRESHQAGLRHGIIYCASRGMLMDRVTSLRRVLMFEAHRYRHVVGAASIARTENGVAETRANFLAMRIMHDGEMQVFATGRYLDRIDVSSTPYRFIERLVVLDSQKIDTLLVIPL
ncbi:MAG TPA: aromatic-ring-hydroxylating dioxygenase subunit beta [Stellaceae bacterium]|jgi:3-phenylpropionate/cinnamic acid dioxygenase small subunit|nr:aromatic-ring-hydroxylating dioxygenase subunit beta [Stellaceae bacterium]